MPEYKRLQSVKAQTNCTINNTIIDPLTAENK